MEEPLNEKNEELRVKNYHNKLFKFICWFLAFLITVSASGITAILIYKSKNPSFSAKLSEIDNLARKYYSGEIDDDVLEDYLAAAYIKALDDKYGFYRNTEDAVAVENSFEGNTSGIGVTVFNDTNNNSLTVIRVDEASPAYKAGIKKGDKIIAIDGKTVEETGFEESVKSITREIGKTAKITLIRDKKTVETEVTYEDFVRQTVYYEVIDNYGYVVITAFNKATVTQFKEAYNYLLGKNIKGFIFDVRDNGGGTVDSSCEILDMLVGECDLITIKYADGSKKVSNKSDANKCDLPMVVLTNGDTASAAELFAATLRDMAKSPLIGNTTYGKGVVQRTYFLSDNSCIRFTVGEFFPAGGEGFNAKGLTPDYEVKYTKEQLASKYTLGAEDPYIQKAVEVLDNSVK